MAGIASTALIALIAPVLACATSVDTPSPEDARVRLSSIIRSFDSADLAERLDASQRVAADPELTLSLLEESFRAAAGLSAEQLLRLEQAAFARFCLESRAAMGVQYNQINSLADGVEISAPLDGFDAMRVLQPGDLIRKLDATPVRRQNDLRAAILSYSPGDEVVVEVVRRGEPLTVRLRMGNFDHLDARGVGAPAGGGPRLRPLVSARAGLDARTLQRAWTVRRQRLGGGLADAATPLALAPMPLPAPAIVQARAEAFPAARVQNGRLVRIDTADATTQGGSERVAAGGGSDRVAFDSPPGVFAAGVVSLEHDARAVQLAQQMARTQMMLERQQRLAQRPGLPADAKQALEADVARLKAQLAELSDLQRKITLEPRLDNADLIVP
jgi:hypothetical protein